jgi:hypothetical protein
MAIRSRKLNKRQALEPNAQAWLRGVSIGFFKFKSADELEELWIACGNPTRFHWHCRNQLKTNSFANEELVIRSKASK